MSTLEQLDAIRLADTDIIIGRIEVTCALRTRGLLKQSSPV
jgi:hypothetical protein